MGTVHGYRDEKGLSITGFYEEVLMGIGASVFLLAVGGVLAFAVTDRISGVDLTAVGYILMGAGALGLIVTMLLVNQRSHTSHTSVEERRNINE